MYILTSDADPYEFLHGSGSWIQKFSIQIQIRIWKFSVQIQGKCSNFKFFTHTYQYSKDFVIKKIFTLFYISVGKVHIGGLIYFFVMAWYLSLIGTTDFDCLQEGREALEREVARLSSSRFREVSLWLSRGGSIYMLFCSNKPGYRCGTGKYFRKEKKILHLFCFI